MREFSSVQFSLVAHLEKFISLVELKDLPNSNNVTLGGRRQTTITNKQQKIWIASPNKLHIILKQEQYIKMEYKI